MKQYQDMLRHVITNGALEPNRTGTASYSVFGYQFRHDMRLGFPLLTTKKMFTKAVVHELLWMISGSTNIGYLNDHGVTIWDEWADEFGDLGPIYGKQWREWEYREYEDRGGPGYILETKNLDQLATMIDTIKNNPTSRRNIVTAWNPADIGDMALPPCHMFFQVKVYENKWLDLHMYQRSADIFLGVPVNIASYGLLLEMLAQVTGLKARTLVTSYGDLHLYENHLEQAKIQLERKPMESPKLFLNPLRKNIDDFTFADVQIIDYKSYPVLKGDVAI